MAAPSSSPPTPSDHRRPSNRVVALVAVPLIALTVLGYAGEALFPALAGTQEGAEDAQRPLVLIMLTPSLRNFGLMSTSLDPWSYFGLGVPRVLLTDPLYYLLGFWYGDAAIKWMERRTRTMGTSLRQVEQSFAKYAYPILFALPYVFTNLLAGAARLRLWKVLLVRAAGITTRIALVRWLGWQFDGVLENILGWIGEHRGPLLVVTVGLVLLTIIMELRRGETKVGALTHLEEDLDSLEQADDEGGTERGDAGAGAEAEAGSTESRR